MDEQILRSVHICSSYLYIVSTTLGYKKRFSFGLQKIESKKIEELEYLLKDSDWIGFSYPAPCTVFRSLTAVQRENLSVFLQEEGMRETDFHLHLIEQRKNKRMESFLLVAVAKEDSLQNFLDQKDLFEWPQKNLDFCDAFLPEPLAIVSSLVFFQENKEPICWFYLDEHYTICGLSKSTQILSSLNFFVGKVAIEQQEKKIQEWVENAVQMILAFVLKHTQTPFKKIILIADKQKTDRMCLLLNQKLPFLQTIPLPDSKDFHLTQEQIIEFYIPLGMLINFTQKEHPTVYIGPDRLLDCQKRKMLSYMLAITAVFIASIILSIFLYLFV